MKMSGRLRYVQLARLVWRLPTYARVVWGLVRDPRTPLPLKGLLAAGLAYVAMPLDLIPDAIPIIGQADDITVLLLVLDLFIANAPEAVREEQIARARNGTAQLDQDLARLKRSAGDAVRPDPRPPAGAAGALRRPAGLAGGEGDAARLAHAPAARRRVCPGDRGPGRGHRERRTGAGIELTPPEEGTRTTMKVILKHDVKGLGRSGDVKEVKGGYARNYLLPNGAAVVADAGALKNWERHRVEREERDRAEKADAEALAERLRGMKLEVAVKAGEKNRLFGSVTNREIAELIAKEGIEVDRHAIHLREPIKTVGDHRVDVRLMAGVEVPVTVTVVPA